MRGSRHDPCRMRDRRGGRVAGLRPRYRIGAHARAGGTQRGYTRLEGTTLAENVRLVAWARRFGFDAGTEPHSGGLMRVTIDLEHHRPSTEHDQPVGREISHRLRVSRVDRVRFDAFRSTINDNRVPTVRCASERMSQRRSHVEAVRIATARPLANQDARRLEVAHDLLHRSLGDADARSDVAKSRVAVERQCRPARARGCSGTSSAGSKGQASAASRMTSSGQGTGASQHCLKCRSGFLVRW